FQQHEWQCDEEGEYAKRRSAHDSQPSQVDGLPRDRRTFLQRPCLPPTEVRASDTNEVGTGDEALGDPEEDQAQDTEADEHRKDPAAHPRSWDFARHDRSLPTR